MKKSLTIFFSVLTVLFFSACTNNALPTTTPIPVTDIVFEPSLPTQSLALAVNGTYQLNAKAKPDNATNKKLSFSSNAQDIVSVSIEGLITAKKVGQAVVTVTATNTVSKKINITVTGSVPKKTTPVVVKSIELSPNESTISLVKGTSRQLNAQVKPENAAEKTLTYFSDNEGVASVDTEGRITAKEVGNAKITIKASNGVSKEVTVTVTATSVAVTDIIFDPAVPGNPLPLSVGGTCPIHAKVQPENATDKNLTYTSDNEEVASVDAGGLITATAVGSAKITIKAADGVSKEVTVTVTAAHIPVTDIAIPSGETAISVENGATHQIGAYVVPENATNKKLTYSSDDETVAFVNDKGEITAKQVGSTVITITAADDPAVSKKVTLNVTKATVRVTSIEFNPPLPTEPIELFLNEIYKFDAKAMPEEAENRKLKFKTSDHRIAWLEDIDKGWVKADGEGEATVTITSDDNPFVKREVRFKMMRKPADPSISIDNLYVSYGSDGNNDFTFTVKTLNGKLNYTPEVVGGGTDENAWLAFVGKDNTNANTDTVHLRLKQNKTVWDRTAYIKFKDNNTNKYIISAGKELQVELTQKKNDNPNVTIKWVHGIGEPNPSEKEKIETPLPGQTKKFYWNDDKIFWWNETTTTKWFNNRKVSLLGIAAPEGADGNQCWAKTASNMLHWWFVQNEANINKYIENKSQEEKDKYAHYYKRELPTTREKEKSYIANSFRIQASNSQQGNYTISGLAWYLYGKPSVSNKNFEGPSLFKDIFSKENTPIKVETVTDQTSFNEIISKALESKKAIGIDIWGSKGGNDYAHAITLWGAAFDEEGNIIAIYVVDNNFEQNRIFPYGIWYKEGKPYLFNYGVNGFVQNRYVGRVTTLDKGEAQWEEWKSKNP